MAPSDLNMSDEEFNHKFNIGALVVLRGMYRDTVFASTEMQDINGNIFIPYACGMRKSINRLGNAFSWPNVRYRDILPLEYT